ncbi:MAG: D-alanyl-D-alanine carboxypeptidase/D-alanyl-D-alanine-endopeptidase [Candidatus Planktophila sp.]|nr:D-alanyl-D-alanine carboxypeptidase/D-alanyl-D-alanine-endopeptidase [Candidatus Planktophila sp.]
MRAKVGIFLLSLSLVLSIAPANAALSAASIPAVFDELLSARALFNPAMILIDGTTGEVVYERNSYSQRKPASVMKLLAGVATLKYLDPQSTFATTISLGVQERTLVIQGSYDPWISLSHSVARKMKRESLPYLAFNSMSAIKKANGGSLKRITVLYSGLYSQDVANLKSFWAKRRFKPTMKAVSSDEVLSNAATPIVSDTSPPLYEVLDFMLKWSDNSLADRLARLSSRAAGNAFNASGVSETFTQILTSFEIDASKLVVVDASGLSKENRVTAQILGQLLYKVRKDEKYNLLYTSLPVGGVSGTLRSRFLTTAPKAVGLVRAKTGTLNGAVTLAGYVESTDREYIFVTLADEIPRGASAEKKAREAIDRLLGRIAAPNIPAVIPEVSPAP